MTNTPPCSRTVAAGRPIVGEQVAQASSLWKTQPGMAVPLVRKGAGVLNANIKMSKIRRLFGGINVQ